jgi:hypothetical protein
MSNLTCTNFVHSDLNNLIESLKLSDENKARENELRPQLNKALTSFKKSRYELGRILTEYRTIFSGNSFTKLAVVLNLPRQTAYDLLDAYKTASTLNPKIVEIAEAKNIDLGKKANAPILEALIKADAEEQLRDKPEDEIEKVIWASGEAKKESRKETVTKKPDIDKLLSAFIDEAFVLDWSKNKTMNVVREAWEAKQTTKGKEVTGVATSNSGAAYAQVGA